MIGEDPLAVYAFHVEVDSIPIAQFKEVEGLTMTSLSYPVVAYESLRIRR